MALRSSKIPWLGFMARGETVIVREILVRKLLRRQQMRISIWMDIIKMKNVCEGTEFN
jgi:hypothetical protein